MVGETEVFHARREAGMQHTHAERELVIGGDEGPGGRQMALSQTHHPNRTTAGLLDQGTIGILEQKIIVGLFCVQ